MSRFFKSAAFPILIVVVLAFFASRLITSGSSNGPTHSYQTLVTHDIPGGEVKEANIKQKGNVVEVKLKNGQNYEVGYVDQAAPELIKQLTEANTKFGTKFNVETNKSSVLLGILTYIIPFVLFLGFWIFLMNQVQGGGSKVMSFGKSRAKRLSADSPKITFRDVAGVDEAVEELHEIKEFLENPKKFQALGARIPTGVLLYGPPGTGKTLLARAVAGEAGVPFFSISGSDFVEMFVGVGASRVRDLFEQAKQNSPCIIFMDEIDAVGRHRGAGLGGGHDEREQTLNQLLVEMDGFEAKDNIIMIAATNRPDILDPALLRPGRFDRQIAVDRPDRKGRAKILEVHTRGKPLAKQIDIDALAGQTPGFTGADLSNLINEAALLAARTGKREIDQEELEEGIMRVIAGPEKKTRVMSEKERLITAYHEMGHALVGHFLEHSDPVHKISVISRGQALGYTISMPQEDRFLTTRAELNDTMAMTLGGRAAEEIVFGEITTGASNDLEKVTATAKQMVMRFGMSDKLGPRVFGHEHSQPFLGREFSTEPDYSDEIAREIDDEVRRIIESAHQRARDILTEHRESLTRISEVLLKRETIEKEEFLGLLAGKSEQEVFGVEEEPTQPELPSAPPAPADRAGREAPRPLPRPGLAGGTAELRGTDPERPELT
jgi:cell division protease FtsH